MRYPSTDFTDRPWDSQRTATALPVSFYAGGPEHVQRHHLYARFVTMALNDLGLVGFDEPFPRLRLGGLIIKEGAKMSKSRGNVIGPDPYVQAHGADVLRCALLFTCPWEAGGDFHDDTISGIERFFARVWKVVTARAVPPDGPDPYVERTILAVTDAIERLSFNVGLARLMELSSAARTLRAKKVLVQLLAPFAPHFAEELWQKLGQPFSVHTSSWPAPDQAVLEAEDMEVVVQVNGRVRAQVRVGREATEADVVAAATKAVGIERPDRVVYVPGRLVNLVV